MQSEFWTMRLRRLRIRVVWVEDCWDEREDGFEHGFGYEMARKVIFEQGLW